MRVEIMYAIMWPVALACFSVVIVSYAKKYDKRIAAIYGVVMAVVVMFTAIEANSLKELEGLKDIGLFLQMLFQYMAFTGAAILLSISIVAEKRPIKVKRWLRFSYLCLGISLLLGSIMTYRSYPGIMFWKWDAQSNMLLVLWMELCISLHRKQSYTKKTCILPFAIIVIWKDMSTKASLLAVVVIGIAAIVAAIKMGMVSRPSLHSLHRKDTIKLFFVAGMAYSLVLLIASVYTGLSGYSLPNLLYNIMAIAFVLIVVLVLLLRQERMNYLCYVLVIVWDVVLALLVEVLYPKVSIVVVVLFSICLLPVLFFAIRIKKGLKLGFEVSHSSVLLMMESAILCCGLRERYMGSASVFAYLFWLGAMAVLSYTMYCMVKGRV